MLRHLTLIVCMATPVVPLASSAQEQAFTREIQARARVFPEVGPGVAALKRDAAGHYYILAAPANAVTIYGADGHRIGLIPNAQSHGAKIVYASDLDIDADGRLFVADRGSNTVKIFSSDGTLVATVDVATPMSLAALSGLEFAATLLHSDHLVNLFSARGALVRAFGEASGSPRNPAGHAPLASGRVSGDGRGEIFFAFTELPDPTIRRYDRFGYAAWEASLPASEFRPPPGARQWTTVTIGNGQAPPPKPVIHALAVDPETEEIWAAIGNELVHFDKDGNRRAAYLTATKDGARLEAAALLVEHDRLLIADDPSGIFDFALPEPRTTTPPAH
ncbi:MAG TPA: hypothetical protein VEJ45_07730 [Candidatus Acidoferrales bacterium]|nr:hypothetical protein [Candidatus Acidoferrales bacterium]